MIACFIVHFLSTFFDEPVYFNVITKIETLINVGLKGFLFLYILLLKSNMSQVRFELTTYGLEDRCSIQLSHCDITRTIIEKSYKSCNDKMENILILFFALSSS